MLDWMIERFDAQIVFVLRHPGAVAASKIYASGKRYGEVWDFNGPVQQETLTKYKLDEQFKKDYLHRYEDIFQEQLTPVAGHTILWCLENMIPINHAQKNKLAIFFYEDLVKEPEKGFGRMTEFLGLEKRPDATQTFIPSQQAPLNKKDILFGEDQLSRWMKYFHQNQIDEIDRILKYFSVTIYNAHEPMPAEYI
jgi:hypothetical protein